MRILTIVVVAFCANSLAAQELEKKLLSEDPKSLAADVEKLGDARRGAVLFHRPETTCAKCHSKDARGSEIAPDLAKPPKKITRLELIESVLTPSKTIRKGYEVLTFRTKAGVTVQGILVEKKGGALILRKPDGSGGRFELAQNEIARQASKSVSAMPKGLMNQLGTRQQFLDLIKYLETISNGGPKVARDLRPPEHLLAPLPLPEYEKRVDHAGMIKDLGRPHFSRGKAIYERLCINCHGTKDKPGSLPTALRFAEGKFKNGNDPHAMYRTLTRGFGLMAPQRWMVPQQKYDVIHYIRETFLRENKSQLFPVDEKYLAGLPKGDTRGPAPRSIQPWVTMDYGYALINTYEVPGPKPNFAYKGIAVRLDPGSGGVSRGKHWAVFDHDTLRLAAIWSADETTKERFIDYNGIHFNGRHAIHPKTVGHVHLRNTGPGWANPQTGDFKEQRIIGRDNRRYGPLPRKWGQYRGLHLHDGRVAIAYSVGQTSLLETPGAQTSKDGVVFTRTFEIGPRESDLILAVAERPDGGLRNLKGNAVVFGTEKSGDPTPKTDANSKMKFDGATYLRAMNSRAYDLDKDFTIRATIRTRKGGGVIFARTRVGSKWVADGKALFLRGGRLTFDLGWVGAVAGRKRINDGKLHRVAMTYAAESGKVRLFVDGKLDREGVLKAKQKQPRHEVRIGFAAPDFPKSPYFVGEMPELIFHQKVLSADEIATGRVAGLQLLKGGTPAKHKFHIARGAQPAKDDNSPLIAGLSKTVAGAKWESKDGRLLLRVPAGKETLRFAVWTTRPTAKADAQGIAGRVAVADVNFDVFKSGGSPWWRQIVKTNAKRGNNDTALAADVLTLPINNPWHARLRLTGLDFADDGKTAFVSAWDGSVWKVTGIGSDEMKWKRFAAGLFQPLGVRVLKGRIFVSCRDQIAILEDVNNDGECDFFRCFNNDHQVTEHFHEFAMGLQSDSKGNLYYAKSARHARTALVPHHGTLLKVEADGSKTTILANGFRAANGVCLNPDGSFFVTDQEGHWTPKNRINHVRVGGFYGNMMGYHDVKDSADSAMQQPLCWITNRFDRSPAELLWVDAKGWGGLSGQLLSLSYGEGKIYAVAHEKIGKQSQGGMTPLPLPVFPTGVMRGRFHPKTGHLYLCGMFAWAGNRHKPGGMYVVRPTGKPICVISEAKAKKKTIEFTFTESLDRKTAESAENWNLKFWDLRRRSSYGSRHYNERAMKVEKAELSADGKTVSLTVADLKPTWCYSVRWSGKTAAGRKVESELHGTIHALR